MMDDRKPTPIEHDILEALREGSMPLDELADATGRLSTDLEAAMVPLARDNFVRTVQAYWPSTAGPTPSGWLYSLSSKGRLFVGG